MAFPQLTEEDIQFFDKELAELVEKSEATLVKHYQALLHAVNTMQLDRYTQRDFGPVFEKYLHN